MDKKKKILIAEDEKPLSKALQLKLEKEDFIAKIALDGEETINFLDAEDFDLLLLDLVMPKKDGFEVLKIMKEKEDKTPVIVVSNLGQEEDYERTKKFGVEDYLVKANSSLQDIINRIKKFFKKIK